MVILRSCCCWQSVKSGSVACGIYSMTFYSVIVTAGSFHVNTILHLPESVPVLLVFSILMLIFAGLTVMASVVLIVGLCTNNRLLLLPWIGCISMTTILDVILSVYLVSDSVIDPFFGVLIATDYFICALNVYCVLCVTSQYQELASGHNLMNQDGEPEVPPAIHLEAASSIRPHQSPARMVSVSVIRGSPTSTICRPLLSGSTAVSRAPVPSNFINSASPVLMLSRSSFSSTSEISFCSSDLLSVSRRSSALPSQDIPKQGLSPVGEVNPFPSSSAEKSDVITEVESGENADGSEPSLLTEKDAESKATIEKNEQAAPTRKFQISSQFPSKKSTTPKIKISILDEEEQSDADSQKGDST